MTRPSPTIAADLTGRAAVVVGGASGLGQAIAQRLGAAGAHVVVADIDLDGAEHTADAVTRTGGRARAHAVDATRAGDVRDLFEAVDALAEPLGTLVLSAAVEHRASLSETTDEAWQGTLDTNVKSAFLCMKAAVPRLAAAGGGSVVALGSTLGQLVARDYVAYCASKAALNNLCKQVAVEHAADGVRVNVLAPSACDTGLFMRLTGSLPDPEGVRGYVAGRVPMGRLGTAAEVAEVALFLASPASAYLSGAVVPLDGGLAARRS